MPSLNLISVSQFCARNGVSRSTFYNLARQGLIKYVKVGSRSMVPIDAERAFLEHIGAANIVEAA
jgi:excisionase family DNA binding protein